MKLRRQMQLELKRIQAELGTTFVYVTHDQEEALAMSDRIAVMNDGVVEQVGSPREMYERPATAFCADFIGCARVPGRRGRGQAARLPRLADRAPGRGGRERALPGEAQAGGAPGADPHRPGGAPAPEDGSRLEGVVADVVYLGSLTQYHVDTKVGRVVSHRMNEGDGAGGVESGRNVVLTWPAHDSSVLAGSVLAEEP